MIETGNPSSQAKSGYLPSPTSVLMGEGILTFTPGYLGSSNSQPHAKAFEEQTLISNSKFPAKGVDTHVLGKKTQLSTRGGGIFFAGGGGEGNERAISKVPVHRCK